MIIYHDNVDILSSELMSSHFNHETYMLKVLIMKTGAKNITCTL